MSGEAARYFNDAVRRDPKAAHEQWLGLRQDFLARGITFDGEPMATFLRPQFVDTRTWGALAGAATRLVTLAERVAKAAFGGRLEELLDFLDAPEAHRPLLRVTPPGPDVSLSRVDGFIGRGGVRLIEINSDAPAGFGYADRMTEVFSALPLIQDLRRSRPIEAVGSVDALVAELRRYARVAKPRVAIVDLRSVRTLPDQEILREEFERRGLATVLIDPRDMEIGGGKLLAEGQPVDLVYRRTVISEVLGLERDAPDFFEAYRKGLAVFVNSFRCYLSEDKAFFALLTDEHFQHLLSAEERAFVAAHVPWTRKVEERETEWRGQKIDLVPWMEAYRADLVLKPSHGYGGDRVTVGSTVDELQWSSAIQTALTRSGWIVQERVEVPEEEFPVFDPDGTLRFESLKVNTNPFYVGGARVGAVTRVSRDAVINVSAGGGSVPTFVG